MDNFTWFNGKYRFPEKNKKTKKQKKTRSLTTRWLYAIFD